MGEATIKSPAILRLPAKLNSACAIKLKASLKARSGKDLTLDASSVTQLGTLCLQILICARVAWDQAGHILKFKNLSAEMHDVLIVFGVDPSQFGLSEV